MTIQATSDPKTLEDYLALPYGVRITADPTGGYVADVDELPGCITQAETWEEIREMARDAMATWISAAMEAGRPVPVPEDPLKYSRQSFVFPRKLMRDLVEAAYQAGVTLDDFVLAALTQSVLAAAPPKRTRDPTPTPASARPSHQNGDGRK